MRQMRASRATLASRGFITRAASALIFVGASALTLALPGDASENHGLTPSLSEWQNAGAPAPSEHWLGNDVGSFRLTGGDRLHDRILRTLQNRVHQEPERAAKELHGLIVGGSEGRDKLRQMLLNAAENKEMVTPLDIDNWWKSYYDRYLLDLADSSLNELLRYGEERMEARLGFVRNVNLEYRSPLGGRTGSGALSFLGAVSEYHDSALVWHLRAYHNEDKDTGGNIGFIYRRAYDGANLIAGRPALVGGNVYLDYQGHDAGEFLRYSLGGEVRTGAVDLYANYYIPLTDRQVYNGRTYYTAEGFDVEANVGVPGADWASAILGYYWFDDDDGRDPEGEQKGTKVGFRLRPTYEWEFELNYDIPEGNGNEEVGGRFSFNKRIGENADRHSSRPYGGDFNPRNHFFDIPRREYSQRIRSYGVAAMADDPRLWWANNGTFENNAGGGITDVNIAGAVVDNNAGVAEIAGVPVSTYYTAEVAAFLVTTIADVLTATVQINGGADGDRAAFVLGRVDNGPGEVTVDLIRGGGGALYVFDLDLGQVNVRHGAMVWDSIAAPSWLNEFASEGITVVLSGTALSVNVPSDGAEMDAFALYEGRASFGEGVNDGSDPQAVLNCTDKTNLAVDGRDSTGGYKTECYGDIGILDSTGLQVPVGTGVNAGDEMAISAPTFVQGDSGASFVMRAGRDDHESAMVEIEENSTTLQVLNDADNNIRYVQGENFSIGGTRVYCDPTSGDVAVSSGRAVGYCLEGLNTYLTDSVSNLTPRAGAVNEEIIDLSKIAKVPNDVRILGVSGGSGDPSDAFEMRDSDGNPATSGAGLFANQALEPGATYVVQLEIYLGGSSPVLHNLQVNVGGNLSNPVPGAGIANGSDTGLPGPLLTVEAQSASGGVMTYMDDLAHGLGISKISGTENAEVTSPASLPNVANETDVNTSLAPAGTVIPGGDYDDTSPLTVYDLPDEIEIVAIINQPNLAAAFPNGRSIANIGGLQLVNAAFANAVTAGLISIAYSEANNELNFGQGISSLTAVGDNRFTVDVTADNIRGTHELVVNVQAVDQIVIENALLVPEGPQDLGALADYTGVVSWTNNGSAPNTSEVRVSYAKVGGADQADFEVGASDGVLRLSQPLGAAGEKVVEIEVTHTPVGTALQERLLIPFTPCTHRAPPCFPNPTQTEIEPVVRTVQVNLRTAAVTSPQPVTETEIQSEQQVSGLSLDPPQVAGGNPDYASGGTWTKAGGGTDDEWAIVGADGSITGTPPDMDPNVMGEYDVVLNATFTHPMLNDGVVAAAVRFEVKVIDTPPVPATVTFTPAGTNGNIAVQVIKADGTATLFTTSPAVANADERINVLATPDAGYHVSVWMDISGPSTCASAGETGRSAGTKICSFLAVNDADYEIGAAFAQGAIHADLPETGDVPGDFRFCRALGGDINAGSQDFCAGFTASTDSAAQCVLARGTPNCGPVFTLVRDCNLNGQPAMSAAPLTGAVTCNPTACVSGEIAVGGSCVTPAADVAVTYSQPANGVLAVFRASDGSEVPSGQLVPHSALLSASATPASSQMFVSSWTGTECENDVFGTGSTGAFNDVAPKFCHARVTVALDIGALFGEIPVGYQAPPDIHPTSDDGIPSGGSAQALCEGFGGFFSDLGDPAGGGLGLSCDSFTGQGALETCTFSEVFGNAADCGNILRSVRQCNLMNRTAVDLSGVGGTAACSSSVCDEGKYPLGATCLPDSVRLGTGGGLEVSALFGTRSIDAPSDGNSSFFFSQETGLGEVRLARVSFAGGAKQFRALPDQTLPPGIEAGTDVNDRPGCEAFLGDYEPVSFGSGACTGVATNQGFCVLGTAPRGTPPCSQLLPRVRTCNLQNMTTSNAGSCGLACPEGLHARGSECIRVKPDGTPEDDLTADESELPDGIDAGTDINDRPGCEAFLGNYEPVSFGSGACTGVALRQGFCVLGVAPRGTPPCSQLLPRVRTCSSLNMRTNNAGACGPVCRYGTIARGNKCIAPTPGGIQIGDPDNGVLRSTSHQDLAPGNNPLDDGQVVMLVATPTVGYHVAEWMGDCASVGTADPFRNTDQTCSVTKVAGTALNVNVRMSLGVLPDAVPVDGDIPDVPATLQAACGALGGSGVEVTLGVEYCYGYAEQEATLRDDDPPASVEGIGIKTQCWVAQGSYADTTRTDTVPDSAKPQSEVFGDYGGNRQLCRNALTHVRDCNKMNRPGLNNLETFRVEASLVCPSSASTTGPDYCLPDNAGPGTGGTPDEMVCGAACGTDPVSGEQLLAVGGRCIPPGMVNNLPLYLTNL